jgi:hypothetical protein
MPHIPDSMAVTANRRRKQLFAITHLVAVMVIACPRA